MLTSEEKEILTAIREQMDDEQKEACDEMSEAEKKEFLREALEEARRQVDNLSEEEKCKDEQSRGTNPKSEFQMKRGPFPGAEEKSFQKFVRFRIRRRVLNRGNMGTCVPMRLPDSWSLPTKAPVPANPNRNFKTTQQTTTQQQRGLP